MTGLQSISRRQLEEEAQHVIGGTSFKFVTEPSINEVKQDVILALKQFSNSVRLWDFNKNRKNPQQPTIQNENEPLQQTIDNGLGTKLRPNNGHYHENTYLPVSKNVDAFLYELQTELLDVLDDRTKIDKRRPSNKETKVNNFLNLLAKREDIVAVPTDKTNSITLMDVKKYKSLVEGHLDKDATPTNNEHLVELHKEASQLLSDSKDIISANEHNYIKSTIMKRDIPTIKLLSKDHKKMKDGNYPTRLVVPAKNYTAGFPHVGYKGIKNIMDRNNINYSRKTIVQASHLKEQLEDLNIRNSTHTIVSMDIEVMYPSVSYNMVKTAVNYFLKDCPEEDLVLALRCLDMIKFGMSNTLITFGGKYYEYGKTADIEGKGLTIGGYESAWLADLVAAYILERSQQLFDEAEYDGIYRDDGLVVLKGKKSTAWIEDWLINKFQKKVNEVLGSDKLQFTMVIWDADNIQQPPADDDKIDIIQENTFPYLDMEFYWRGDELNTRVHIKENQKIKYLNKDSAHTNATFNSIPSGVERRLTILTSITPENKDTSLDMLYPIHYEALTTAHLIKPNYKAPTLQESYTNLQQASNNTDNDDSSIGSTSSDDSLQRKHKKERDRRRSIYFVVGYSKIWGSPISSRIKRLALKYGLKGLRFKMAYKKFTNLGEKLNGDLNKKLMKGIVDLNKIDRPCNCNVKTLLADGRCMYDGDCRKSIVVYEHQCLITGKSYIGKTQQHHKQRVSIEHFADVWKVIQTGRAKYGNKWTGSGGYAGADSFAKHFANLCRDCNNRNEVNAKMKEISAPRILWQGDPIQCMKSACTANCKLCMVERIEILHRMRTDKSKVINDNSDIFAPCKCKSKFHKFSHNDPTLTTRKTQKKVPTSTRHSKQKRSRFSFGSNSPLSKQSPVLCSPCSTKSASTTKTPVTPEPASPVDAGFLIDMNLFPGPENEAPNYVPITQLTNLQRDQLVSYERLENRVYDV